MKHARLALPLLTLSFAMSGSAWAACTTSAIDAGVLTTVTVTSGPSGFCEWMDNNPNNAIIVNVTGVVVPALGVMVDADFISQAVAVEANLRKQYVASCHVSALTCTANQSSGSAPPNAPFFRHCAVDNKSASTSATATCIYYRLGF